MDSRPHSVAELMPVIVQLRFQRSSGLCSEIPLQSLLSHDTDAFAIGGSPRRKEVMADLNILCGRLEQLQVELMEQIASHQPDERISLERSGSHSKRNTHVSSSFASSEPTHCLEPRPNGANPFSISCSFLLSLSSQRSGLKALASVKMFSL